jgi:hemoglobin-like flavoprotein
MVRTMFPEDMSGQKKKLTAALALVVANLRTPQQVRGALHELGARHVGYGTKPEHYELVCQCLVAVMEEIAGEMWSAELAADWLTALRLVSQIMLEGAAAAGA